MKNNPSSASSSSSPSPSFINKHHHHHHQHHGHLHYHQQYEFDSDDDTSTLNPDDMKLQRSSSSTSYISKHKKRRSNYNINNKTTNNYGENITFDSWKISIINSLRDVIVQVEHRQKLSNYNPNNYNDEYHTIASILKDDKKLYKIFNRITSGARYMTMKQYIASMSLIQKSKTEISSIATKLLNDDKNNNDNVEMPPSSPNFVDLSNKNSYNNYFGKKSLSTKKLPDFDAQSMISTLSTLSYLDDTQSIISDLSATSQRRKSRMRYSRTSKASVVSEDFININDNDNAQHQFKLSLATNNSMLSNIDGAFSILENAEDDYNYGADVSDEELNFQSYN